MQTVATFLGTKVYGAKYEEVRRANFPKEVLNSISKAEVVEDAYGNLQICFHIKGGGRTYKALSTQSGLVEGDVVRPNSLVAIELSNGDNSIVRLDGEAE